MPLHVRGRRNLLTGTFERTGGTATPPVGTVAMQARRADEAASFFGTGFKDTSQSGTILAEFLYRTGIRILRTGRTQNGDVWKGWLEAIAAYSQPVNIQTIALTDDVNAPTIAQRVAYTQTWPTKYRPTWFELSNEPNRTVPVGTWVNGPSSTTTTYFSPEPPSPWDGVTAYSGTNNKLTPAEVRREGVALRQVLNAAGLSAKPILSHSLSLGGGTGYYANFGSIVGWAEYHNLHLYCGGARLTGVGGRAITLATAMAAAAPYIGTLPTIRTEAGWNHYDGPEGTTVYTPLRASAVYGSNPFEVMLAFPNMEHDIIFTGIDGPTGIDEPHEPYFGMSQVVNGVLELYPLGQVLGGLHSVLRDHGPAPTFTPYTFSPSVWQIGVDSDPADKVKVGHLFQTHDGRLFLPLWRDELVYRVPAAGSGTRIGTDLMVGDADVDVTVPAGFSSFRSHRFVSSTATAADATTYGLFTTTQTAVGGVVTLGGGVTPGVDAAVTLLEMIP